jgi:glycosyltransferase involved in cell wall biosynthesis
VTAHALEIPPRGYLRERAAVAAIARAVGADILHTHGYRPDVVDGPLFGRLGLPVVTTVHGFTGGGAKNQLFEWLQVRAYRRFDGVVAVARPIVERLVRSGVPAGRVHCIPNAWAPGQVPSDRAHARERLGLPADGPVVGWVGRLSREKAPDVLLEALGLMGSDAPRAVFVGAGTEAASLSDRARALGIEGKVRWAGRVDGAAALFRAFDVFVLSSRTEGTPIVLFEAMAAGVPVIATHVGGVPDVVSGAEALLVPAEDPAELARALRAVLADPAGSAARASAAGARLARDFAEAPWLERYEALYRNLIGTRRPA